MLFLTVLSIFRIPFSSPSLYLFFFFFFNDTATTEIYTLSLHDALPIYAQRGDERRRGARLREVRRRRHAQGVAGADRKSTRLNSSHLGISYAVFCLKKKKKKKKQMHIKYIRYKKQTA